MASPIRASGFVIDSSFVIRHSGQSLPESPRDVILGLLLRGASEELGRGVEFDQLAQIEKGRVIGHSRGLLHVEGDDDYGVVLLELQNQVFDLGRGERVDRKSTRLN